MAQSMELPEKLDQAAAEILRTQLLEKLHMDIALDGTRVRIVGGACAQLLLSAARQCRDGGGRFAIDPSDAMSADIERLGLGSELLQRGDQA